MPWLPPLPDDIIIDILSHLPAKSLVKFRCVSKRWNSLIRSQKFAKLHFITSVRYSSRQRVLLRAKPFYSISYDDLDDFGTAGVNVIAQDGPPPVLACVESMLDFRLVGECNGVICMMLVRRRRSFREMKIERSFCLWNPSTRECKEVCRGDVGNVVDCGCMFDANRGERMMRFDAYGFGYGPSSDDYKIVRLVCYELHKEIVQVEVYRVGSRTWRKMEVPVYGMISWWGDCLAANTCSNGKGTCHWIMTKLPSFNKVIVSFDLREEKLEEVIPLPELSEGQIIRDLRVFGGKLALLIEFTLSEIWVMDEYGVGSSWTKKVTLCEVSELALTGDWLPISFSRNGGVLVCIDDYTLMLYDPEKKTYKGENDYSRWRRKHMVVYAESLFSPNHIPNADECHGL